MPLSRSNVMQPALAGALDGLTAAQTLVQSMPPSPASAPASVAGEQGTMAVQLHTLPLHDVELWSWGAQTLASIGYVWFDPIPQPVVTLGMSLVASMLVASIPPSMLLV